MRPSWGRRFDRYVHNNVVATQRLLEATASRPERRFVYASSSSVYGDAEGLPTGEDALPRPLSPYGVTKLAAEQLCGLYHAEQGVETVALRFFSVYGPRQRPDMAFRRFCHAALDREPDPSCSATAARPATSRTSRTSSRPPAPPRKRRDAAGGIYNIGGGSRVSLNRTLEVLAAAAGRPLDVRRQERETGDVLHTGADIERARADLGYAPRTDLATGLRAELAWVAEQAWAEVKAVAGAASSS